MLRALTVLSSIPRGAEGQLRTGPSLPAHPPPPTEKGELGTALPFQPQHHYPPRGAFPVVPAHVHLRKAHLPGLCSSSKDPGRARLSSCPNLPQSPTLALPSLVTLCHQQPSIPSARAHHPSLLPSEGLLPLQAGSPSPLLSLRMGRGPLLSLHTRLPLAP